MRLRVMNGGKVVEFLCIHQTHVILKHWSGPTFPLSFAEETEKSKISLGASVPRSLSMFPRSGSISGFRRASCSSHSFCVSSSCMVTHTHAAAHIHTQPRMHKMHYILEKVWSITRSHKKKKKPPPSVSVLHQRVGKLSQHIPPRTVSSAYPRPLFFPLPSCPTISFSPNSSCFDRKVLCMCECVLHDQVKVVHVCPWAHQEV